MDEKTCPICNGANLRSGQMTSFSHAGFKIDDGATIPMTEIDGTVCLDCGALSLSIDPTRLKGSIKPEAK